MQSFFEPISASIWDLKYRYRQNDTPLDQSIEDTWRRVAKAIAMAEKKPDRAHWEAAFYNILEGFQFLPGGRILAGAGTSHAVTLFNCFVMNIGEDSLKGIFKALAEGARTLQQGGGVGYDFSVLRPKGSFAEKRGVPASGPVSFMNIWDAMCKVLLSTGARRGAMMGVLRCDHPDIEAFIEAKGKSEALRHFNVSIMVTDAFMYAVKQDQDWALRFPVEGADASIVKTVKARQLWEKIIRAAYQYAEPGVLFADTINRKNNLWYCEKITSTNPCGEIPLPPYGACDLGAINLTQMIDHAFLPNASLNWQRLEEVVPIAIRFLDNVINVSRYPLRVQREAAHDTRRIGLGITGLGDAFIMLGHEYGSPASLKLAEAIMKRIAELSWQTSIELAIEKGRFPLFQPAYLQGEFVKKLPTDLQTKIAKHGIRNSHHNTVAPAGTISLLANNVSNGIEPAFHTAYTRHLRLPNDEIRLVEVRDYAYHLWLKQKKEGLPPAWCDASTLNPLDHLNVQAALQPYIDNAISKTINLPLHFPFEELQDIYTQAYQLGLKGCTIFRPNPVTGSVLNYDEKCCDRSSEDYV